MLLSRRVVGAARQGSHRAAAARLSSRGGNRRRATQSVQVNVEGALGDGGAAEALSALVDPVLMQAASPLVVVPPKDTQLRDWPFGGKRTAQGFQLKVSRQHHTPCDLCHLCTVRSRAAGSVVVHRH
jgi:hypothetical protein